MTIYKTNAKKSRSLNSEQKTFYDNQIKDDFYIASGTSDQSSFEEIYIKIKEDGFYDGVEKLFFKSCLTNQKLLFVSDSKYQKVYASMPLPEKVQRFFVSYRDGKVFINEKDRPEINLFSGYLYEFIIPKSIYESGMFKFFDDSNFDYDIIDFLRHDLSLLDSESIKVVFQKTSLGERINFLNYNYNILNLKRNKTYELDLSDASNVGKNIQISYDYIASKSCDGVSVVGIPGYYGAKMLINTSESKSEYLYISDKNDFTSGDNVRIKINDGKHITEKDGFYIIKIIPNDKYTKFYYGSFKENKSGGKVNVLNLKEYNFFPQTPYGDEYGGFNYRYFNGSWRSYFPYNFNIKAKEKKNSSFMGTGSKNAFYFDQLEQPEIRIVYGKTYKFTNYNEAEYPFHISKKIDSLVSPSKNDGIFIDKKDYGEYSITFLRVDNNNIDPYQGSFDPYDPYSTGQSKLDLYYISTGGRNMGNAIYLDSDGMSFDEQKNYNKKNIAYPYVFMMPYSGKYIVFNYGEEHFSNYLIIDCTENKTSKNITLKNYDLFSFYQNNKFSPLKSIRENEYFVVDIFYDYVDELICNMKITEELGERLSIKGEKFSFGNVSDSSDTYLYIDVLKKIIKEISEYYVNSMFSINIDGEPYVNEILTCRKNILKTIPSVKNVSAYVYDQRGYSLYVDEFVKNVINTKENNFFPSSSSDVFSLSSRDISYLDCSGYIYDTSYKSVYFIKLYNIESGFLNYRFNIEDYTNSINFDYSFYDQDKIIIGPLVPRNISNFNFSKNILYQNSQIKNAIKSFVNSILSNYNKSEKIVFINDSVYESVSEIERLFLQYSSFGFNSLCIYLNTIVDVKSIPLLKSVSERFNMNFYIYLENENDLFKLENPCQYYYLGNFSVSDNLKIKYTKVQGSDYVDSNNKNTRHDNSFLENPNNVNKKSSPVVQQSLSSFQSSDRGAISVDPSSWWNQSLQKILFQWYRINGSS